MLESQEEMPVESLKRATATTIKAIGRRGELEVAFVRDRPAIMGDRVKIAQPDDISCQENLTKLRGAADSVAVRLRHHDPHLHAQFLPADEQQVALFDALEQARCEALAARRMAGLSRNVGVYLEAQTAGGEATQETLLHLAAHEKLGNQNLSPMAHKLAATWRAALKKEVSWEGLVTKLQDQESFALEAQKFLLLLDSSPKPSDEKEIPQKQKEEKTQEESEEDASKISGAEGAQIEQADTSLSSAKDQQGEAVQEQVAEESAPQDEKEEPLTTYRIWSKKYDEIVKATDLCSSRELSRLRHLLDRQLRPVQKMVLRLASKLQRRLMAQQKRSWIFDQEEGFLDGARLARIVANPLLPLSFKVEKESDFRDAVVTILIDNSGSMRGRPITLAAISADILARTLERCTVKTEILGFTTRSWKGGRAREDWVAGDKPARPGRMNEIRHIVYKEAAQPWRRTKVNMGLMLREGLLKENIDGEALLWAHKRLLARPEARRILMVISDGAPVDDSTLSQNPDNYLEAHLRSVIDWIERCGAVELCAIGIGHDVTRYYKRAVQISSPDDLGESMTEQLASLFERR